MNNEARINRLAEQLFKARQECDAAQAKNAQLLSLIPDPSMLERVIEFARESRASNGCDYEYWYDERFALDLDNLEALADCIGRYDTSKKREKERVMNFKPEFSRDLTDDEQALVSEVMSQVAQQPRVDKAAALIWNYGEDHKETRQEENEKHWFFGLLEEVAELGLALLGHHKHPGTDTVEHELCQVGSIALNWLRKHHREHGTSGFSFRTHDWE